MLRRNKILSITAFSIILYLAIIFRPQTPQTNVVLIESMYSDVIAIELGEISRVGVYNLHTKKGQIILEDQGGNPQSCTNNLCIKRPNFDEEIASQIIKELKTTAEGFLGRQVTQAVISVPAYFNDTRRQSVKEAAERLDMQVHRIYNEPYAAVKAYDIDRIFGELNVFVYNINSKTVDITLEVVDRGVTDIWSMSSGNIGSESYDRAVWDKIGAEMRSKVSEATKVLSSKASAKITYVLDRMQLQQIYEEIFNKTLPLFQKVLDEAKLEKGEIDRIILTGELQHIAKVQPFIEKYFGKKVLSGINSDEVILQGVAKYAGSLFDTDLQVSKKYTPLLLGVDNGGIFSVVLPTSLVPARSTIAITTITDNQSKISLDILVGARMLSSKNKVLGTFDIEVSPARAGLRHIEVLFHVNADGILTVSSGKKKLVLGDVVSYDEGEVWLITQEAERNEVTDLESSLSIERDIEFEFVKRENPESSEWFHRLWESYV